MPNDDNKEWNFPVARTALGVLGLAVDLAAVATDAATEGLKAFSAGVKEIRSRQK